MAHYIYPDKYGMYLFEKVWHWQKDNGEGDSVGRNVDMAIALDDPEIYEAIKQCFIKDPETGKIKCWRHPDFIGDPEHDDMSRDHYVNAIIGAMYFGDDEFLHDLVYNVPYQISPKAKQTIDLWLWARALTGKRWARILMFWIDVPQMLLMATLNGILSFIGAFSKEMTEQEYMEKFPLEITDWQKKIRKVMYPKYAFGIKCMQIWLVDECVGKILTQWIMRLMTGTNLLNRMLTGQKVTRDQIHNYPPMIGGRLSTNLNEQNDRHMAYADDFCYEEPFLDKALLYRIFEKVQNNENYY